MHLENNRERNKNFIIWRPKYSLKRNGLNQLRFWNWKRQIIDIYESRKLWEQIETLKVGEKWDYEQFWASSSN